MAINDLYELSVNQVIANNKIVNRFHLRDSLGASDVANAIIANFRTLIEPSWVACQSTDCRIASYTCLRVNPMPGGTTIQNVSVPGTDAGDVCAPQTNALVAWYTNDITRRGRGRMHLSGLPETEV